MSVWPTTVSNSNCDSHLREVVHLGLHDVLGQAKLRDAVDEDAARLVERLEHDRLVAEAPQVARAGQARRARADDGDAPAGRRADGGQLDAALLALPVGQERLDLADRDGEAEVLVDLGHHAVLLALALLRADAPADGGQEVGLLDEPDRAAEVPLGHELQEPGHVDADRAARDARLVLAGEAAHGLGARLRGRVGERDLADVARRARPGPARPRRPSGAGRAASAVRARAVLDARRELFGGRVRLRFCVGHQAPRPSDRRRRRTPRQPAG